MDNPECKPKQLEQAQESFGVNFNEETGTLLLDIGEDTVNLKELQEVAAQRGLVEKDEFHLTIIGSGTAKQIIENVDLSGKGEILSKIRELANSFKWKISFKPEFYYIKKEYNDPNPDSPDEAIPETRESIIQMADIENLDEFYKQLKRLYRIRI